MIVRLNCTVTGIIIKCNCLIFEDKYKNVNLVEYYKYVN